MIAMFRLLSGFGLERCYKVCGMRPVFVEYAGYLLAHGRVLNHYADFAAALKARLAEVLTPNEESLAVDEYAFGM